MVVTHCNARKGFQDLSVVQKQEITTLTINNKNVQRWRIGEHWSPMLRVLQRQSNIVIKNCKERKKIIEATNVPEWCHTLDVKQVGHVSPKKYWQARSFVKVEKAKQRLVVKEEEVVKSWRAGNSNKVSQKKKDLVVTGKLIQSEAQIGVIKDAIQPEEVMVCEKASKTQ